MRTSTTSAGPSIARRARIWLAPQTDIELHPDTRPAGQKLRHASLFAALAVIVVPWVIVVGAMFAVSEVVRLLDERWDRRWSDR